MSRATGGWAWGATSTRSSSRSWAIWRAFSMGTMPNASSVVSSKRRTFGMRICSLMRSSRKAICRVPPENEKLDSEPLSSGRYSGPPRQAREVCRHRDRHLCGPPKGASGRGLYHASPLRRSCLSTQLGRLGAQLLDQPGHENALALLAAAGVAHVDRVVAALDVLAS